MNNKKQRSSAALIALSGAASALTGMDSFAATPLSETQLSYRASQYREADIDAAVHSGGASERYEIDTQQLSLLHPLSEHLDLAVDYSYETMSGASPWYITPDAEGAPTQVMSGASISETRHDLQSRLTIHGAKQTAVSLVAGFSDENDYQAKNIGAELEHNWPAQQLTMSAGIGYSDDSIEPTEGGTVTFPTRVAEAERDNLTAFIGLGVTLNRYTALQTSLSVNDQQGFLSDPYKLAFVQNGSQLVADARPDSRQQVLWQLRLRRFVAPANAAFHADYRFFDDDWDVTSHTAEFTWLQNLPAQWRVDVGVRYYSQTAAYFYAPYYISPRPDQLAASDYRLSPYGAISFRIKAVKPLGNWSLQAEWESYRADADWSHEDVEVENPALVEFDSLSLGLSRKF